MNLNTIVDVKRPGSADEIGTCGSLDEAAFDEAVDQLAERRGAHADVVGQFSQPGPGAVMQVLQCAELREREVASAQLVADGAKDAEMHVDELGRARFGGGGSCGVGHKSIGFIA